MSQYPSPYSAPQYQYTQAGFDPAQQYLQPAKNAGLLMIIMGAIGVLLALCIGVLAMMFPQVRDQMPADQMAPIIEFEKQSGMSASVLFYVSSAVFLLPSVAFLIVGPFVRRGGTVAVISGLVLTIIGLLLGALYLLGSLVKFAPAEGCFGLIATGLLALELFWLIKAIRNNKLIDQMRYAQQMQMWQYQQQAQTYAGGYQQGYPQQPPQQSPPHSPLSSGQFPPPPPTGPSEPPQ